MKVEEVESTSPDLSNVKTNKTRSKKREFNGYSIVTTLVKEYKRTKDEKILLEIVKNLEGIINTYTLVCTPAEVMQQFFITPHMKKFIGMFLTQEERVNTTNKTYLQAVQRIRWILRYYTYEDMYAKLVEIIIEIVTKMKVVGTCDCIYFIQKMVRFKMYDLVMKFTKDAGAHVQHLSSEAEEDADEDSLESFIKTSNTNEQVDYEESLIYEVFYRDIGISILDNNFDFCKVLTQYEKFLLYLKFGLTFSDKQINIILRHVDDFNLVEDFEKLEEKLYDISQEYKNI